MTGERDPFDFLLAKELGVTLGVVRDMPNAEWVEWRAWTVYEHAMRDLASRTRRRG